jgi:hypothetical protein
MILTLLSAAALAAAPDSLVYHGRAGQSRVAAPRFDATITVDGRLNEPEWARAALLTGFSQYLPADGRAAEDSTEVLLWYSPTALHVGIRAYEAHGAVRATLAERDRLDAEDHVQIVLDTFGDRRQAYVLAVNALGIQADGIRTENAANYQARLGLGNVDLSTDLVFESRGRVTEWGYEVELRIPFKSLRYARGLESWGVNVIRQVQHSRHQDTWAPVLRADASFLARSGTLTGLEGIRRGLSLDVNPELTSTTSGQPGEGGWRYRTEPALGGNLRWAITPELALNATVRPDFSQVEADAGQIPGDSRYAVFFPERRPFFVDGAELLEVPNRLVYTRRIVEPQFALKLAGKLGGTEVAALSALDAASRSSDGRTEPRVSLLRLRRGMGGRGVVGLVATERAEASDYNRVLGVDARVLLGAGTRLGLQAAGSMTRSGGEQVSGPLWEGYLTHNTRRWGVHYQLTGVAPEFEAAAGFVDRTDAVRTLAIHRVSAYGRRGALVEGWRGRVILDDTWLYGDFAGARAPLETKLWLENLVTLRGGWNLALIRMFESFAFDANDYAHYRVQQSLPGGGADTAAFRVSPRQYTGGWYFTGESRKFRRVSASAVGFWGLDPHFPEAVAAHRFDLNPTLSWTPSERLRLAASYAHSEFRRREDNSVASVLDIPRLKVEYQLARPLFLRAVGEYRARTLDALRDPATGAAILLADGRGGYRPSTRQEQNDLRLDWLLSYRPGPGTVLFVGYGSTMREPERLALSQLERQRDGFFVKVSYLWRM